MSERVTPAGDGRPMSDVSPHQSQPRPIDERAVEQAAEKFSSLLAGKHKTSPSDAAELPESAESDEYPGGQRAAMREQTHGARTPLAKSPNAGIEPAAQPLSTDAKTVLAGTETSEKAKGLSEGNKQTLRKEPASASPNQSESHDQRIRDNVHEKNREKGESDSGAGSGDQRSGSEQQPLALGDAILQNFSQMAAPPTAADVPQASPEAAPAMDRVVQQVADHVFVSNPAGGDREVRIVLKESVLPGTEVRITQQAGHMQVQFVTNSPDSQDLLSQNQAMLQGRLNERLGEPVAVSVQLESQGQGEQQEGRSRQRRNVQDELDTAE